MNVDELISEGERLKQVNYDDPDQDLWDNDVREFVKPFGDTTYKILEGIISPSSVIWGDDDTQFIRERIEAITKTQKLLERLKQRSVDKQAAQSKTIAPSFEQAKQQIKADEYGERVFYFYTPEDIKELAGKRFVTIHKDTQVIGHTKWFTIALKKVAA